MITWLANIKNALLAILAGALAVLALWAKVSSAKLKRTAQRAELRAARAEEIAKGYEAAHIARSKADQAVKDVIEQEQRKPKAKLRRGLEGQD